MPKRPLSDLRNDHRGAVMMTGLFMSCFLIGALWFVIGIGDALVFRNRMQEATDHGAFTSAALHAKGMNFISLCNLVLLVAITIHLILGLIHDITLAICIVSIGFSCGAWMNARKIYTKYFDIMTKAASSIHVAEVVASYGYPVMGLVEGMQTGAKYRANGTEVTVIPLSTSLIPGAAIRGSDPHKARSAVKKEGLPVETKPMNWMCTHVLSTVKTAIFNEALGISGKSLTGGALDVATAIIGKFMELRYCNDLEFHENKDVESSVSGRLGEADKKVDEENKAIDRENANRRAGDPVRERLDKEKRGAKGAGGGLDPGFNTWWGHPGPMVVWGPVYNGDEWMTSYAFNVTPDMRENSQGKVAMAQGPKSLTGKPTETGTQSPGSYYAAAEFYFDCDEKFVAVGCNYDDNATFQIKWRARLKKLALPNVISMLTGVGISVLFELPKMEQFKKMEGKLGTKAEKFFGDHGVGGMTFLRGFFDGLFQQAEHRGQYEAGHRTGELSPSLDGVYH